MPGRQRTLSLPVLDLQRRDARSNHAVDIAFQNCWRHAEPDRVDENHDIGAGERGELRLDIRCDFYCPTIGTFLILEQRVETHRIEIADRHVLAALSHRFAVCSGDCRVEAAWIGMCKNDNMATARLRTISHWSAPSHGFYADEDVRAFRKSTQSRVVSPASPPQSKGVHPHGNPATPVVKVGPRWVATSDSILDLVGVDEAARSKPIEHQFVID
jgi:hypothetical protein